MNGLPDALRAELLQHPVTRRRSMTATKFRVVQVLFDGGRQPAGIVGWDQLSCHVILDRIGATGHTRRDDRYLHPGGFQQDIRKAFPVGRQRQHVHRGIQRRGIPLLPDQMHARIAPELLIHLR